MSRLFYSVFLPLFLSHLNSTCTAPSLLVSTIYIHAITHAHTHSHNVSAGVVPDRNKWQLPNYLLTVDADAAWDALLIFLPLLSLSLSPSHPPFYSLSSHLPPLLSPLWWIMHVQELLICIHASLPETSHLYVFVVCPFLFIFLHITLFTYLMRCEKSHW